MTKCRLCLLAFILLGLRFLPAQYLAFPDSGAVWKVDEFNSDQPYCAGTVTSLYTLEDTLMGNGMVYQKVVLWGGAQCSVVQGYSGACWSLGTLPGIRTDTATGKVYAWDPSNPSGPSEIELFDYSLLPGDTMYSYANSGMWWAPKLVVDSVDTVFWGGVNRKRMFVSTEYGFPATIVEGIGPSTGLFVPPGNGVNGESGTLVCYSENGNPVYQDPNQCSSVASCLMVNLDPARNLRTMQLSPNPTADRMRVLLSSPPEPAHLQVFSRNGRLLLQQPVVQEETLLDLRSLPPGIYLLQLLWAEGVSAQRFSVVR